MNTEQTFELEVSRQSPLYFAQNYAIRHMLTADQIRALLHSTRQRFDLGSKRQSFRTSTMLARALYEFCFKPNSHVLFVSTSALLAECARNHFCNMLDDLPEYICPKIVNKTRSVIVSETGSSVHIQTASEYLGRGMSIDLLLLDNTNHLMPELHKKIEQSLFPAVRGIILEAQ